MTINRLPSLSHLRTDPAFLDQMRDTLHYEGHTPLDSPRASVGERPGAQPDLEAGHALATPTTNGVHSSAQLDQAQTRSERTAETRAVLAEYRAHLPANERARFDGVHQLLDREYERWRMATDTADLPLFDHETARQIMELTDHGYSFERLHALDTKGRGLDKWADAAVGGAKSTPFAIATVLTDLLPLLSGGERITDPMVKGYIIGAISAIFDTAGGEALSRAVHDAWWLRVNPADQTPDLQYDPHSGTVDITHHPGELPAVMQKALAKLDADIGLMTKVGQAALAFQTYTVRNGVRTGAAPLATLAMNEEGVAHLDTGLAAFGGVASGAGAYMTLGHYAYKNGLAGLPALLSRRDYLERLEALEKANLVRQTGNALIRAAKLPADILTDGTDALQSVFRPENLTAEVGPLAGGIASIVLAKSKATAYATAHRFSPALTQLFSQAAGTLTMMPVLATWPATSIITNHYKKPAAKIIHDFAHQQRPASGAGVANVGADVTSGAEALRTEPQTPSLLQRAASAVGNGAAPVLNGLERFGRQGASLASTLHRQFDGRTVRPRSTAVDDGNV